MAKFLLATHNPDKVVEIEAIMKAELEEDVEFVHGIDPGEVVEDGDSIEENARIKAHAWLNLNPDCIVLADDTGLFVDALDGAPGIYAARYAGENVTYADNCNKLIDELTGVELPKRTARFSTCAVAVRSESSDILSVGSVEGLISETNHGEGFGYDPVFIPQGYDDTFLELGTSVKNMISHRARAFRALAHGIKDAQW